MYVARHEQAGLSGARARFGAAGCDVGIRSVRGRARVRQGPQEAGHDVGLGQAPCMRCSRVAGRALVCAQEMMTRPPISLYGMVLVQVKLSLLHTE